MSKLRQIFTSVRVWIVIIALVMSLLAIAPNPIREGATIRAIEKDSAAFDAGMSSPKPNEPPVSKERILAVNNAKIMVVKDYFDIVSALPPNRTVTIKIGRAHV